MDDELDDGEVYCKELFVFWKKDEFPFVNGAPAIKMDREGRVGIAGHRMMVYPLKLMPLDAGLRLHEKMSLIVQQYADEDRRLRVKYNSKLYDLMPFVKVSRGL